jgi:mono/diheme cytochrome c family protein
MTGGGPGSRQASGWIGARPRSRKEAEMLMKKLAMLTASAIGGLVIAFWGVDLASGGGGLAGRTAMAANPPEQVAPGLIMPAMNPVRGKGLFASKGCVVCHSINGVGGEDAPKLDASSMTPQMNPFEFFAKMWRGAMPMIMMQMNEIGHQIEFTGQDLADIVAFVHNAQVQKTFTEDDIPAEIKQHMEGDEGHGTKGMGSGMMGGGMMKGPEGKKSN